MTRYVRVDSVLVEPVGHLWAAFSPATGETALLNDESAAILEILESGAARTHEVCEKLSADIDLDVASLAEIVEAGWHTLIEAGLVRRLPSASTMAG